MSRFMLSVGSFLASIAVMSATVLGAPPADNAVAAREANPILLPLADQYDGPFYNKAEAEKDAAARKRQGYTLVLIFVTEDPDDPKGVLYYVYFS